MARVQGVERVVGRLPMLRTEAVQCEWRTPGLNAEATYTMAVQMIERRRQRVPNMPV